MFEKHTWCFEYLNVFNEHCYIWIKALNLDVAEIKFHEECDDYKKMICIREAENWDDDD